MADARLPSFLRSDTALDRDEMPRRRSRQTGSEYLQACDFDSVPKIQLIDRLLLLNKSLLFMS